MVKNEGEGVSTVNNKKIYTHISAHKYLFHIAHHHCH